MEKPAILNGKPYFDSIIPIIRPTLPKVSDIIDRIEDIMATGMITNHKYVNELESHLRNYINVKSVVTTSNCTTGLLLLGKCLKLTGEVITPSFSFSATSLALIWLGLKPVFVDCYEDRFTINIEKIKDKINKNTSAILATHVFGNPCDIDALNQLAMDHNINLIFDSAHGAGSIYKGIRVGNFGDAESFSMSPTKVLTAGEGGFVCTNNDELAESLRIGRNYANPGNYDTIFMGLSGRLAEFNAILALKSLEVLENNVLRRQELVKRYKSHLSKLPGISFQKIEEKSRSSYKDFAIVVDPHNFGISRDELYNALNSENIMTKKYFSPAIHQQTVFIPFVKRQKLDLKITNELAERVLCLPMYSHMKFELVDDICACIKRIHDYRDEIKSKMLTN